VRSDDARDSSLLTPHSSLTFTVLSESTERLDRFLADQLQLSRTQAARLIAAGSVVIDGKPARASPFPITSRRAPFSRLKFLSQ
jgi:RNA-binding protein YlmH